ncbi:DUF443 family protein [Virgibacillus kimchii]
MKCKVNGVRKNLRYRILTIDGQTYILDMGRPFWKIFSPLFYWIFPNTVYKVSDHEIVEKLKSPEVEQTKTGGATILAGTFAVILANLLQPLVNYFDVKSTQIANSIIVMIVILIVLSLYFYMSSRSKKSLYKVLNLKEYPTKQLWIKPQTYKHFLFVFFSYLLFLGLTILSWGGFIQLANAIILFAGMVFFFLSLLASVLSYALGENKVIFKDDNKVAG